MFRRIMAALLVAAPMGAAIGQSEGTGEWALATMPNGCMVQATSPQGTMISIWGFAGQDKLAFLLQNRDWSVRDGQPYKLDLDFVGISSLPVNATARQHIDSDGPGFLFTVKPGAQGASGFLAAFTSATGMRIEQNGQSFDTLPLAGSRTAMAALAKCLADRWSKAPAAAASQEDKSSSDDATTI
ncbi:MAG TPA: hypothetical protein VGD66_12625 [Allosphingosinicella sp.]|jgi:hypothetical protein